MSDESQKTPEELVTQAEKRFDPAVDEILQFFSFGHLPDDLQFASEACSELADKMAERLPPGREKTAGMRKLLEAKDCFVRAVIAARKS